MGVTNALQDLHNALETMQSEYFSLWLGKWTSAIDWTSAVMGTHISAALYSLSHSLTYTMPGTFDERRKLDVEAQMVENEINKYFGQVITYFFGEDYFSIRMQAYDDMLWVVLGWLESIRFINGHSARHYPSSNERTQGESEWHARQFIPAFAHRARIFYELAEEGWDWHLCGGGMTWSPHLLPYKNAITNELFISASIEMYLYFPGDDNCSPFMSAKDSGDHPNWKTVHQQELGETSTCESVSSRSSFDPIYLANAVNGYTWLKESGMIDSHGLYTDGFHIRDYEKNRSKTTCDERNNMIYTYNQGVVLSGLRGLWEATGNTSYLEDGHTLIRNVIHATNWTSTTLAPSISLSTTSPQSQKLATLSSVLGTSGILTEACDPSGTCSQDSQTFKGIFFHHLTTFCVPLPKTARIPGKTHAADRVTAKLHRASCNEYTPWVLHNARAALGTRNKKGLFGSWWNAGTETLESCLNKERMEGILPNGARDYRNDGVVESARGTVDRVEDNRMVRHMPKAVRSADNDLNDRGRGRTVETQGGGVSVTRAMWEFLRNYEEDV